MRAPPEYRCTRCEKVADRDQLTVKRVSFHTMGRENKRLRQRTLGWLCRDCREKDPEWNKDDARVGRAWYPDESRTG